MKGYLRKKGLSGFHSQRNTPLPVLLLLLLLPSPPPPTTLRFQGGSSFILYIARSPWRYLKLKFYPCESNFPLLFCIIPVLSVESPGQLDICFATLLKQQSADVRITTEVKPFRPYEDFAGTVAERCNRSLDATHVESVTKEGLYYFLWSRVEYMGMFISH